jgi:outer membrane protein insertion porin family
MYNDQYKKSSVFTTVSFDNTYDFYNAREGMRAALNLEYAQLDGEDYNATLYPGGYTDIFKPSLKIGLYYGLEDWIDYDLILRLKARATYIDRDEYKKLPIGEKLFMGGIGSVRGFDPYSLSPYYLDSSGNRNLVGGTKRASGSVEASIPLSEAAKMRLAFFYDYGYVGIDRDRFELQDIVENDITRSSTGVVLEWQSGFGPINLVFAYPIDEQTGDRTSVFEFSMGTRF